MSIDIKSGHYIIDNVFRCFIYNGFEYNVFYPIYLRPVISLRCKYKIF